MTRNREQQGWLFEPGPPEPPPYPVTAGWKQTETSREAAEAIDASLLRARVLEVLHRGPGTADEIAALLGVDRLAIRPRCSELRALGAIGDSGIRHRNTSGKRAIVWALRAAEVA